jgi:hypothetical protein
LHFWFGSYSVVVVVVVEAIVASADVGIDGMAGIVVNDAGGAVCVLLNPSDAKIPSAGAVLWNGLRIHQNQPTKNENKTSSSTYNDS